ncbi:DUF4097 domain-containing protein [Kitasatospora sp. NBC_00374]|uniref:DUF4097 family beta strand repeat-containing protein n=1 Tax=Kitasatospora sp. NBC_00374 TaxID=2975964 RepID=UPI0032566A60
MRRALAYGVVTAVVVGGMSGCFLSDEERRDVEYPVEGQVRLLVIEGSTGDIKVTGGGDAVRVTEQQMYTKRAPETMHALADGTLTLRYRCPDGKCGVGYEVQVPAGTEVRVRSSTGGVRLAGLTAGVDAESGTGSISAERLGSATARLVTETGDVGATFTTSPSNVQARTDTGSVSVHVPRGEEYAVTAATDTGSVSVSLPRRDSASRSIAAKTGTGDVTLVADA